MTMWHLLPPMHVDYVDGPMDFKNTNFFTFTFETLVGHVFRSRGPFLDFNVSLEKKKLASIHLSNFQDILGGSSKLKIALKGLLYD